MSEFFFTAFPRFFETSQTTASANRLNARFEAIIEKNKDLIKGSKVLDIASHDGRWSFAALKSGAAHLTAIEVREDLVEHAKETCTQYGIDEARVDFICGDVFDVLSRRDISVDVVLCLGFFYHTIRHTELVNLMERTGAKHLIVDTEIVQEPLESGSHNIQPAKKGSRFIWEEVDQIQFIREPVEMEKMAFQDEFTRNGYTLVGRPSSSFIRNIMQHFGFSVEKVDWRPILATVESHQLHDYSDGWRSTFICTRN